MKIDLKTVLIGAGLLVVGYYIVTNLNGNVQPQPAAAPAENEDDDAYQGRITVS